jgi:hypothetical protein
MMVFEEDLGEKENRSNHLWHLASFMLVLLTVITSAALTKIATSNQSKNSANLVSGQVPGGAKVTIVSQKDQSTVSSFYSPDGSFEEDLPAGKYNVTLEFAGTTKSKQVEVNDQTTAFTFNWQD